MSLDPSNERPIYQFLATLHKITTHVTGSARIELDIGLESKDVIRQLQMDSWEKGHPIVIAAVPLLEGEEVPVMTVMSSIELEKQTEEPGDEVSNTHNGPQSADTDQGDDGPTLRSAQEPDYDQKGNDPVDQSEPGP
jgi:hypothetical protein